MRKKQMAIAVILLSQCLCVLRADTLPFRGGTVLSAEFSERQPEFENFKPAQLDADFPKRGYVAIVLRLNPGRKISIYDYELEVVGIRYRCIAIRTGDGVFDATPILSDTNAYQNYTLLFLLDGSLTGHEKLEKMTLRCTSGPEKSSLTPLLVTNIGNDRFTPPSRIPAEGLLKKESK